MEQLVLKPHNFAHFRASETVSPANILDKLWKEAYLADPFYDEVLQMLQDGTGYSKKIALADCNIKEGYLWYPERWYVPGYPPLRCHLLHSGHHSTLAVHSGRAKTLDLVVRQHYSPTM